MKEITKRLSEIQKNLVAQKTQKNDFGGYMYRSCEDILTAVKPLLDDEIITVSDTILQIGERYYVEATASFCNGTDTVSTKALARESEKKKGMDDAQVTGSTSSYARKYALNGLLAIDDTADPDKTNKHGKDKPEKEFANDGEALSKYTDAIDKLNSSAEIEKYTNSVYQKAKKELSEVDYDKFINYSKDAVNAWGAGKKDVGAHVFPGEDLPL